MNRHAAYMLLSDLPIPKASRFLCEKLIGTVIIVSS